MLTYLMVCPSCSGSLRDDDSCAVCKSCGVIVKASRGGWRFPLEPALRPLPGLLGRLLWKPQSNANPHSSSEVSRRTVA